MLTSLFPSSTTAEEGRAAGAGGRGGGGGAQPHTNRPKKAEEDYELKPAPGNPDRVRPSITARLKDGTRGQEPPKEPGQKRSHKNHEER